jgi:hypothetical protein
MKSPMRFSTGAVMQQDQVSLAAVQSLGTSTEQTSGPVVLDLEVLAWVSGGVTPQPLPHGTW